MGHDMTFADTVPRVSVLMPVYNGASYLAQAIDSILLQTYTNFELIVVDDGSTDDTWEIVSSYRDRRIRPLRNAVNCGLPRSLNRAIAHASGQYIARMDGDDISLPMRFAVQVEYLDRHPEIGVLGTYAQVIDACGHDQYLLEVPVEAGFVHWSLCFFDPIIHPSVMFRRQLVGEQLRYNDESMADDYALWSSLSTQTRLSNLPMALLRLRKHADNFTVVFADEVARDAMSTSQEMLAHWLGNAPELEVVKALWRPRESSQEAAIAASDTIRQLYDAVMTLGSLSATERLLVARDAVERLFGLAWFQQSLPVSLRAGGHLREIWNDLRADSSLNYHEVHALRKDIAQRQYALGRMHPGESEMWSVLAESFQKDPANLVRILRNISLQMVRRFGL